MGCRPLYAIDGVKGWVKGLMAKRNLLAMARMTDREYRANHDGLNMFFGAVLGIVLSGTDGLNSVQFGILLVLSASTVVTILYVSASAKRISYAVLAAVGILALPFMTDQLIGRGTLPAHLQPTLAVWLGFIVLVEFAPRERNEIAVPISVAHEGAASDVPV